MKINNQIKFIVINKQANSLYSLIADGLYRSTSLGRDTWQSLIGSKDSLQIDCNREGFNAKSDQQHLGKDMGKARIGILGNDKHRSCDKCDSRIGFGTGGLHDDSNTCGNEYGNSKHTKGQGYILVQ